MKATKRLYNVLLLAIILGGLAIRLIFIAQLEDKLWWVDEVDYLTLGQSVADGNGFAKPNGEPTAFRPPGYPLLLAGLNTIGIDTVAEIRIVQAFISTGTLFILFLLSLKIAGPVAALIATAVAAGYPYFIFGAGTLFAFTWFSFTLLVSVYFLFNGLRTDKKYHIALAGLFMGLTVLTRTSAAILTVMVMLWLLILLYRAPKKFIATAFIYGIMMTLVVAPWLARNVITFGKPVLSTNGGRNLWLGNNPESTINTGSDIAMPKELERRVDYASEIKADAIYSQEAINFIKAHPFHFIKLSAQKGLALWRLDPSPTTDGYPRFQNLSSVLSIVSYSPILLFALLGLKLANRDQRKVMLLWILFAMAFTLLHAVFITKVRFRLPLDYFLIIMAGSALSSIVQHTNLLNRLPTRLSAGFLHDQHSPTFSFPLSRHR